MIQKYLTVMLRRFSTFLFPLLIFALVSCKTEKDQSQNTKKKVVIGYVPGYAGVFDATTIDADKLTHINYAFVDVQDSMAVLTNIATDTINFRSLNGLKALNPDLKLIISIGGWSWSENFSDAVLTESSRKKFSQTSVAIVERYDLDGVDIDWEYPGLRGEDNVFRAEDRENFTLMFRSLREELDALSRKSGKAYQLTTAIPCFQEFISITDMGKASQYLDYVNIMSYDFYVNGEIAGHHSNLFPSESYENEDSGHRAYQEYTRIGVPAEKLVLGIPFYGRSWFMKTNDNRGINRAVDSVTRGGGYTFIKDSLLTKPGFTRYWDEKAKAPYLWNEQTRQLVVYDDEESIKVKCEYVKEKNMAGVMFWQYASDPKEYLITAINQHLY
jgi:chitinase